MKYKDSSPEAWLSLHVIYFKRGLSDANPQLNGNVQLLKQCNYVLHIISYTFGLLNQSKNKISPGGIRTHDIRIGMTVSYGCQEPYKLRLVRKICQLVWGE